ncbi:hypothetical protein JCM11491_006715 [Sporobolomyces phaffii]
MLSTIASLLGLVPVVALAALELHPDAPGSTYPFALHLPTSNSNSNSNSSPPPAILFLHGSGARGTADEVATKATYDGVGWLLSQYDAGNQTGAQRVVATDYLDAWDSTAVLSVLDAVTQLGSNDSRYAFDPSRVTLAGYSIGAYGAWYTQFNSSYPTRFAAVVAFGGASGLTDAQLATVVPPSPRRANDESEYSAVSIYACGGALDEKQPGADPAATVARIDNLARDGAPGRRRGNWTAVELAGMDHKLMSQDAWYDLAVWEWLSLQRQGGPTEAYPDATTGRGADNNNNNGTTTSGSRMTSTASTNRRPGLWW